MLEKWLKMPIWDSDLGQWGYFSLNFSMDLLDLFNSFGLCKGTVKGHNSFHW